MIGRHRFDELPSGQHAHAVVALQLKDRGFHIDHLGRVQQKRETLSKEYEALGESEFPGRRTQLAERDQGMLSDAKFGELEVAVETANRPRTAYAKQLEKIKVVHKPPNDYTFGADYLNHQLNSLVNREDQVKKLLEQLLLRKSRVRLCRSAHTTPVPPLIAGEAGEIGRAHV